MRAPILVVDDNEDFRTLLGGWLADDLGVGVLLASDGRDATRFFGDAASPPPGLVLLDLEMPGMDGRGLVDWLRRHVVPMPRVVLVSASPRLPRVAAELEVDAYLEKPLTLPRLRAVLAVT